MLDANPCNINQKGYFFFLAGTLGGDAVERTCTIPKGKAIFFPVYNAFQTIEDNNPNADTIPEIKQIVIDNVNQATNLKASVDGVNIKVDNKLRALSNVFKFILGEDNIFGPGAAGTYISVSDGYWVPLKPLKPGNHEISFSADGPPPPDASRIDVTYHITVQ